MLFLRLLKPILNMLIVFMELVNFWGYKATTEMQIIWFKGLFTFMNLQEGTICKSS